MSPGSAVYLPTHSLSGLGPPVTLRGAWVPVGLASAAVTSNAPSATLPIAAKAVGCRGSDSGFLVCSISTVPGLSPLTQTQTLGPEPPVATDHCSTCSTGPTREKTGGPGAALPAGKTTGAPGWGAELADSEAALGGRARAHGLRPGRAGSGCAFAAVGGWLR